jgi:hypothetical protein
MKLNLSQDEMLRVAALAPAKARYQALAEYIKAALADVPPEQPLPTAAMFNLVFDEMMLRGGEAIRKHGTLMTMAGKLGLTELKAYVTLAPPKELYGRMVYPKLWHAPKAPTSADEADLVLETVRNLSRKLGRETALEMLREAIDLIEMEPA